MKVLITSGGTKVNIDKVRSITNMSRGTFGSAICKEFLSRKQEDDFLMAEGSRNPFTFISTVGGKDAQSFFDSTEDYHQWMHFVKNHYMNYNSYTYKTFEDYQERIMALLQMNKYDMVILAAAVSDYGVSNYVDGKIRSTDALSIHLTPYPKIISKVKELQPNTFLVGFKLLVGSTEAELIDAASDSIKKNKCNVVIANDLEHIKKDNHTLLVVSEGGVQKIEKDSCVEMNTTLERELVNYIILKYMGV
jgi:phosphopantothenate--cysteine ligase